MSGLFNEILHGISQEHKALKKIVEEMEKTLVDLHKWKLSQEKQLAAIRKQIESIHTHDFEQDTRLDVHGDCIFELGDGGSAWAKERQKLDLKKHNIKVSD